MASFELRQLSHFVAIADTGSYRSAARQLYTAQPALSVSIRKLETSLGVQLFERSNRGVTLTPAGEAFLKDARAVLGHAERGKQSARMAALGELGLIRLAFVGSASYQLLPERLPPFLARYPSASLELMESASVHIVDMLRDRKLDIGIMRRPMEYIPDIDFVDVQPDDLIAALPSSHPLARCEQIDLIALRDEPFIVFSRHSVPGMWAAVNEVCRASGFTPRVAQATTQALTMIGLVGSGLGVALVPGVIAQYTTPPVSFVRLTDPQAHQRLMLSVATRADGVSQAALMLRSFLAGNTGPAPAGP